MIYLDDTVAAGGAFTEAYVVEHTLRTDSAIFQYELSGATQDTDIHLEARLSDAFSWQSWIDPRTALASGAGEIVSVDLTDIPQIRLRIVNNDTSNQATVQAAVSTGSE